MVEDVNDELPSFSESIYSEVVSMTEKPGRTLLNVSSIILCSFHFFYPYRGRIFPEGTESIFSRFPTETRFKILSEIRKTVKYSYMLYFTYHIIFKNN